MMSIETCIVVIFLLLFGALCTPLVKVCVGDDFNWNIYCFHFLLLFRTLYTPLIRVCVGDDFNWNLYCCYFLCYFWLLLCTSESWGCRW